MKKNTKVVAIVFAKEESEKFSRCSFPILGRPVVSYPLMAACHAANVEKAFLSTKSKGLMQLAKGIPGVQILERKTEQKTVLQELKKTLTNLKKNQGMLPEYCAILFGNSPCILSETIESAVDLIIQKPTLDSVVTVARRDEFNPNRSLKMLGNGQLSGYHFKEMNQYSYFIDSRLIIAKTSVLLKVDQSIDNFNQLLGKKIHPIFLEDGMGDIDYAWQVPHVERWLKINGFSEGATPYPMAKPETAVSTGFVGEKKKAAKTFKVLVTTVPFGAINPYPLEIMETEPACEYVINPIGRKLKEDELAEMISDYNIVVAGTEPISEKVLKNAPDLKLISRVGIGLDSVDLNYARDNGIKVSYTPDAPAPAVGELTIGHMLNMSRYIPLIDRKLREGVWQRIMGHRLMNLTIGIIGTGRVGSRVLKHLQGFSPKKILVNDLVPDKKMKMYELYHAEHVSKEQIYKEADIITLHLPLTDKTDNLINNKIFPLMKKNVVLINTSRGGMINEKDLFEALSSKRIHAAAIDVFENEPYGGELLTLDSCYFSCHMGSCTVDCRFEMEKLATEEAMRYVRGDALEFTVPEYEYELQKNM